MSRAGNDRGDERESVATEPVFEFGKYRLIASLGRGGMADVFLAVARGPAGFNKLVVIKRLRSSLSDQETFVSMFMDEARLAARLNHPNVVHTYEVGEHEGAYFLAMEYLDGQPLNRIIRELSKTGGSIDLGACARIASDALAGLHYAHDLKNYDGTPLQIVHRDVSPHNVFVTYDGQVKVVDFGIAKAVTRSTQTEVGVLKGKVAYMSPEQAMEAPVDRRSDVFAMGIVLWELVARKRLFPFDSAAATLNALVNQPIPKLSSAVPGIDASFEAIVMKALEKDANNRYASALEMREALEGWIATKTSPVRVEEVGRQVAAIFEKTREKTQRQIHEQMAQLGEDDLADETPTALERLRKIHGGVPPAPGLITIGSGSGSGIIAVEREPPLSEAPPPVEDKPRRASLLVFLALLVFALAMLGLVVLRILPREVTGARADPSAASTAPPAASPVASASAAPAPIASADPEQPAPPPPKPSSSAPLPPAPRPTIARPPATPSAAPAPAPDEPGYLTFDTYPWTRVTANGRVLGTTPLIHVALAPGSYTLTLDNPDANIQKTYPVTIKSGETTKARLGLSQ